MTTPISNNRPVNTAAPAAAASESEESSSVSGPVWEKAQPADKPISSSEATALWQKALGMDVADAKDFQEGKFYLGEGRIERYQEKVKADMQEFVAKNPNATPAELKKAYEDSLSKHVGYETVSKMTDDYFMSRMMARAKELTADLWE